MQNLHHGGRNIMRLSGKLHQQYRCLSITALQNSNLWNPVVRQRNSDLGRHLFEAFAIRTFIDQHPDMNAAEIHDVTQGLLSTETMLKNLGSLDSFHSMKENEDLFNKLGELELRRDIGNLSKLLDELSESFLSKLPSNEKLTLIKSQHPKYILKQICEARNLELFFSAERLADGSYEVLLTCGDIDSSLTVIKGKSLEEMEHDVCLNVLQTNFFEEFNSFQLDLLDTIPESEINFQPKAPVKREVSLTKSAGEAFGFTIRGGEQKVVRNKEYIQQHIVTPVFISEILPDSPAQRCNLMVGDVLLGINNHSLQDCTHKQAVTSLRKFAGAQNVTVSVKHSKKELLKYEAEQKYLARQKEKIREEIKSKGFGKWHEAKAKMDPEEYFLERLKEKKRPFQAKKHRQSMRLWDH